MQPPNSVGRSASSHSDTHDFSVHLLDVGPEEYGDAVLCRVGQRTILIDGAHAGNDLGVPGHPSIPEQLASLLGTGSSAAEVDLLVVSHAHADHIGCLPKLVQTGLLRARWALLPDPDLSWGRAAGAPIPDGDAVVAAVVAALREEPPGRMDSDAVLATLLADAVTLEQRYRDMIARLSNDQTQVVRFGRDDPAGLLAAFSDAGLRIFGPSNTQMLLCAELINAAMQDAAASVDSTRARGQDASPLELYRQLLAAPDALAPLDAGRLGAAVNLQSLVLGLAAGGTSALLTGDMQFSDPGTRHAAVRAEVAALRAGIAAAGPFGFAKLSHHGSDNAFDAAAFDEWGAPIYGICAGAGSTHHPAPSVLAQLTTRMPPITWVRTDRNGQSSVTLAPQPAVTVDHGAPNDPRPNLDAPPGEMPPAARQVTVTPTGTGSNVIVRVAVAPDVEVTISLTRGQAAADQTRVNGDWMGLAARRPLPRLLFAINGPGLRRNIGTLEADEILARLQEDRAEVLDVAAVAASPIEAVRSRLARDASLVGVVLVGGYDILPSVRLDALPPAIRARVGSGDPDDFIVWSDDGYGDVDGDGITERPVSRIPDGKSAELVSRALQVGVATTESSRRGVRNVARPFADSVFAALPGSSPILVSQPSTYRDEALDLRGSHLYFMLHGDYVDGSRFWGEGADLEAVNVGSIPALGGATILAGCCWGALTVDTPAARVAPGRPFGQRTPSASIALSALVAGARAFVGCTGAHYSPTEAPYQYFGGPLHGAFWAKVLGGVAPAQALFEAKREYVLDLPHGRSGVTSEAIEYKIWRQFTCLGLGW